MFENKILCWLVGFGVGVILGRVSDGFLQVDSTILFCVFCLIPSFFRKWRLEILCFLMAFFWGVQHSAPWPKEAQTDVQIQTKNLIPQGLGLIVRHIHSGDYFYVHGRGRLGDVGNMSSSRQGNSLLGVPGFFRVHLPHEEPWIWFTQFRSVLDKRILRLPWELQGFCYSIFLGDQTHLGELLDSFKILGLFHLLVVSGLHIAFLSAAILWLLLIPFQGAYAACLLSPRNWYKCQTALIAASIFCVGSYALALGFAPSVQRAVLLFACDQFFKVFSIAPSQVNRLGIVMSLQTFLFPLDVLSLSSILSWSSYFSILAFVNAKHAGWKSVFYCQLILGLFLAALLGQVSIVGVFLNLVIVPIFPFIFLLCVLLLFDGFLPVKISGIFFEIVTLFLRSMERFADWANTVPGLYFELNDCLPLRYLCLCLGLLGLGWGFSSFVIQRR